MSHRVQQGLSKLKATAGAAAAAIGAGIGQLDTLQELDANITLQAGTEGALSKTTIRKSGRKGGALNMCASEKIAEEGNGKRVALLFSTPWDYWRKYQQATNN